MNEWFPVGVGLKQDYFVPMVVQYEHGLFIERGVCYGA